VFLVLGASFVVRCWGGGRSCQMVAGEWVAGEGDDGFLVEHWVLREGADGAWIFRFFGRFGTPQGRL